MDYSLPGSSGICYHFLLQCFAFIYLFLHLFHHTEWGLSTAKYKNPTIFSSSAEIGRGSVSSVPQSCQALWPHGLQHARPPSPSPTPRACLNSRPSSQWRHLTISSSVIPFSSSLQSFLASGSFPMSQFFPSGDQSIGASASASVFPIYILDWFPFRLTGLIFLQSKGLWRVFSNITVQKHKNSLALSFLYAPTLASIYDYWKNHSFG